MQDENRENRTEPQEVVSWYVRPEGQEVVDCYVQPRPLPSGAAPQTPREPEKRSRKGLWSFLIAAGVLVLAVVIFGYGVYCFSYYRWIFPYLVKKYARSGYKNSSYLQNPIRLRFYSTGFDEESEQNTLSFRWQQFKRVVLEEDIYMLELREGGRTLLIPRHALGEEKFLLDELIRTVCGKYKLPLDTTY